MQCVKTTSWIMLKWQPYIKYGQFLKTAILIAFQRPSSVMNHAACTRRAAIASLCVYGDMPVMHTSFTIFRETPNSFRENIVTVHL